MIYEISTPEALAMYNLKYICCHVDNFCNKFIHVFEQQLITYSIRKRVSYSQVCLPAF